MTILGIFIALWEIDDGKTPSPQRQRVPGKRNG